MASIVKPTIDMKTGEDRKVICYCLGWKWQLNIVHNRKGKQVCQVGMQWEQ